MTKWTRWLPLTLALTAVNAAAQTSSTPTGGLYFAPAAQLEVTRTVNVTPARENVMVWGGLGTELVFYPGVNLGISVPVGQVGRTNLALRGSVWSTLLPIGESIDENGNPTGAAVALPIPSVSAELLLSTTAPGVKYYGGPSVGKSLGTIWLVGATAGLRNESQSNRWGWYAEGRVRAILLGGQVAGVSPGLGFGATYSF